MSAAMPPANDPSMPPTQGPTSEVLAGERPGDAALVVATVVGVAAVVGLVASTASLVLGDFEDADHRWVAVGGVVFGIVALVATWSLLRRLQRSRREQLGLPLEGRLLIAEMRRAVENGSPLPKRWRERAVRLYGRLVASGLQAEAEELQYWAVQAQARPDAPGDKR